MADKVVLTKGGFDKLMQDLTYLKTVKRQEVSKALAFARELGDLRESGEYESAKHAQALLEDRIKNLEDKLCRVYIVEKHDIPQGLVSLGTAVTVKNLDTGDKVCYTLVGQDEASLEALKISVLSPIGQAFIGKKVNDEAVVTVPAGTRRFKIIKIETAI